MKPAWLAASVARKATLLLSALVLTAHPAQAAEWMKYEADHLTVYSDCPPYRAKSLIRQFAAFQHAARSIFVPPTFRNPHTTLVYFNDEAELRKYFWPEDQDNLSFRTLFGWRIIGRDQLFATAWDGNIDQRIATMQFRDADIVLQWHYDETPRWLRRALLFTVEKPHITHDAILFRGLSSDARSILAKETWQDWAKVIDEITVEDMDEKQVTKLQQLRFAQLHLLGHWILFGTHDRPLNFWSISGTLREDHASKIAGFEAALGLDQAELDNRLRNYLKTGPATKCALPFNLKAFEDSLRISPVQTGELHLLHYEMLEAGKAHAMASLHLDNALASGISSPELSLARVRRAMNENDFKAAVKYCREAIAVGTKDPIAYLISAEGRLGQLTYSYSSPGNSQTILNQVTGAAGHDFPSCLEEIRTAIRLDPSYSNAYATLGRALFAAHSVTREQAEELTPGISVHPVGLLVRYLRGVAYARAGASTEAGDDFKYLAQNHPASMATKLATDWQRSNTYENNVRTIEKLIIQKQYGAARQQVTQALATQPGRSQKIAYETLLLKIDESDAWTALLTLFRETRWEELDRSATAFLKSYPKSKHLVAVRKMQGEARKNLP